MLKRLVAAGLAILVFAAVPLIHLRAEDAPDNTPKTEAEKTEEWDEAKYEKITEFLIGEYAKIGQSRDWLTRGLATISMARLPQSRATKAVLKVLKEDPSPQVQLVAWECLLARAKLVDPEQYEVWAGLTPGLVQKNVFNGRLRVELLQFLSMGPPDAAGKKIFLKIFDETNSLIANDVPVIEELGHLLSVWKSPDLVDAMIKKMGTLNDAYRAELVLKSAGCPVAWAGERCDLSSKEMWGQAIADYEAWWKGDRENWKESFERHGGAPWRSLTANYLSFSIFDRDAVKANNPEIRKDLELGNPGLRAFDVMFVVDATESMQPPMDYLKGEMRKMMTVMGMMSSQPRIGITFYRDYSTWPPTAGAANGGAGPYEFVAKTYPLTKNVDSLITAMTNTKAMGGGDDPEAVKEGLEDCFKNAGWTPRQEVPKNAKPGDPVLDPKAMILVGDAPPHPGTEEDCLTMAKKAGELGVKIYAVKLTTPLGEDKGNLPSFDQIAAAGNGVSIAADFVGTGWANFEFRGTSPAKTANIRFVWLARISDRVAPSQELMTHILLDAVNVKYKERIEMIVPLLLEMCDKPIPEVRSPFKAAPEPVKHDPGPHQQQQKPHQH